jgi:pimeloyl-ACP methyl ester carboxylesterase
MYRLRTVQPAALAALAVPTLCICGLEDAIVDPEAIRELASILPRGRYEAFEATGHSPYFERAARFNERVPEFIRGT